MRRVFTKRVASPSNKKLSLIKNEVNSLKNLVSNLNKTAVSIRNRIEKNKKEELSSEDKFEKANVLLGKTGFLISGKESEMLSLMTSFKEVEDQLKLIKIEKVKAEENYNEKVKQLRENYNLVEKDLSDKEIVLVKKNLDLDDKHNELLKKVKEKSSEIDKLNFNFLEKQNDIKEIEDVIVNKAQDSEKIEIDLNEKIKVNEKYSTEINEFDVKKKSMLLENDKIKKKIEKLSFEKSELEKDIIEKKEQLVHIVLREVNLVKKEKRIKELYTRAGLKVTL